MSPRTHPNTPTTPGIHPKVKVPAIVGVIFTGATVVAHFVAGQSAVPWLATYGAAGVTVLGALSGYITPSPLPAVVATDVAKASDVAALASQLVKQFSDVVVQASKPVAPDGVGPGVAAPDTSAAFPDPASLPAS